MDIVASRRQSPDTQQSEREVAEQSAGRGTSRRDGFGKMQVWRVLSMAYLVIVVVIGLYLELERLLSSPSETWQGGGENVYTVASRLMAPSLRKVQLYNSVCMGLAISFLAVQMITLLSRDCLSCNNVLISVFAYFTPTSLSWEPIPLPTISDGSLTSFGNNLVVGYLLSMTSVYFTVQLGLGYRMHTIGCRSTSITLVFLMAMLMFLVAQLMLYLVIFLCRKFVQSSSRVARRPDANMMENEKKTMGVRGICSSIVWHHIAATNVCLFVRVILDAQKFFKQKYSAREITTINSGSCTILTSTMKNTTTGTCSYCLNYGFGYVYLYPVLYASVIVVGVFTVPIYIHILKAVLKPTFQQQDTSSRSDDSVFRRILRLVTNELKSFRSKSKQQRAVLFAGCILLAIYIAVTVVANETEIQQSFLPLLICRSITALLMILLAVAGLFTLRHNVRSTSRLPVSDVFLILAVLFAILCDKIANMVVCGFSLCSSSTMRGQSVVGMIEQVTWIFQ